MNRPKVSIIVPIYNVEKYLDRCMESLLNQTLKNIEIILVDDESPDNCPRMCDEYARQDSRVKVIHKRNEGLGYARNSGLKIATGEYIAFVDSDDFVKEDMYRELYDEASLKKADVVFCNFYAYCSNQEIKDVVEVASYKCFEGKDEVNTFLLDMVGTQPSERVDRKYSMSVWRAIYNMDTIRSNNILFPSEREMISEDIVFHISLLSKVDRILYLPTCNYYYCENGASLSRSFRSDRYEKYKILHKELLEKLMSGKSYSKMQVCLSVDRLFIGYVRRMLLVSNTSVSDIKHIINDIYLREIVTKYPYKLLPLKHKFFLMLVRTKRAGLIKLLSKMK